jgi:hypothetical protein
MTFARGCSQETSHVQANVFTSMCLSRLPPGRRWLDRGAAPAGARPETRARGEQSAAAPQAGEPDPAGQSAPDYLIFAAPEEQGVVDRYSGTFSLDLVDWLT